MLPGVGATVVGWKESTYDGVHVDREEKVLENPSSIQCAGCYSHFTSLDIPLVGRLSGGGRERLPQVFRQIIDFAHSARSLLPAERGL